MNRSFRTIWNDTLGAWVAASELDRAKGGKVRSASESFCSSVPGARPAHAALHVRRSMTAGAATLLLATTWTTASAQTLSWGASGSGGAGTWDNSTANWFNGSAATPWAAGSSAAFGGTAGTVTVNGTVALGGATFGTTGYTITGGTLSLTGSTPLFATNNGISATIASLITGSAPLIKTGAGTLTISNGANTYSGGTTVSQGSLVFGANNALGSGTVTLGDANTGASNVSLLANFPNFLSGQNIPTNIVVSGSGTGTVSIGTTSFNPGSNGTQFAGTVTLNRDVTLVSGSADRTTFLGKITGTGNVTIAGSRVTLDNSSNDFVGNVTISSGSVLQTNAANVLPRTATVNVLGGGVLQFNNTGAQTFDALNGPSNATLRVIAGGPPNLSIGAANGSGAFAGQIQSVIASLTKLGTGTQVLSGANTYVGVTKLSGGVLSTPLLANGGVASGIGASSSAAANLILDGGTLQYTGTGVSTNRQFTLTTNGGGIDSSGTGALNVASTAAVTLSGTGARSLTLTGSNTAANTLAATLADNGGASSLIKAGAGTWTLTGNNSYTGGTSFNGGTLKVASDANLGAASGALNFNGGTLENTAAFSATRNGTLNAGGGTFQTDADLTISGVFGGTGALTKTGGSTLTLSGANTYSGATTVASGSLIVNGNQSSAAGQTTVQSGATLGGTGTVGGNVVVANGGTLNPGNPGTAPGTLTINGDLALNSGSTLNYNFGQANVAGGSLNDLTNVGGNLTLAGTLNVATTPGGTFAPGIYRVFNYNGTLTDNGLAIGAVPSSNYFVQTAVANQVNLVNTAGLALNYWDGAGPSATRNNGTVQGGNGTWSSTTATNNWTTADGSINAPYAQNAFAVFEGAPGTVVVDNSSGQVQAAGMQFAADGYQLVGDTLQLTGGTSSTIRVGDGTAAGPGYTATIDAVLSGNTQLVKSDLGTLVLNGTNTYTGGTDIQGGTVRISGDANLGAAAGGLTLDGGTLETTAAMTSARAVTVASTGTFQTDAGADLTLTGAVSGPGSLTKTGAATLTLTGDATYAGGTTISAGTLQLGNGGTAGSISGDVVNNGTLAFDRADTSTLAGVISGSGTVNQIGSGTTVLAGNSTYTGGTTISAGTLQLGNGGTSGAIVGDVTNNGTLAFNRSDTSTLAGIISGSGTINQLGSGTTVLTGNNSYTGATNVAAGSLIVNGNQSTATGLTTVQSGATIGGTGTIGGSTMIANDGTLSPGNPGAVPGTLSINGDLALNTGAALNYNFGQANVAGGALNDLTKVGGDLTLAGTLNVVSTPGSTFAPGVYRVIDYSGGLTNNGLTIGTIPSPDFFLQTSVAKQVNLINTAGLTLRFWDGAGNSSTRNDGVIQGGDGVWQSPSGNDSWTNKDGTPNAPFTNSAFAVFQGAPGAVTVDNSLGQVQASGMQFATNGYHLTGNPIELTGAPQSIVRVGDGTADGAGYAATVDNVLTGNTQLVKTDLGTLTLNGNNTYAGGTAIQGGTVRIASDANLGAAAGGLTLDGGVLQTTASIVSARNVSLASTGTLSTDPGTTLTLSGSLAGAGSLTKAGSGTLLLTGTGTHTGETNVVAGTLQTGAPNVLSPASAMTIQSGATLNLNGFAQTIPSLTNAGTVAMSTTPGTSLTVTGNYTGADGVIRLNTALGDDNSPTDRLTVKGDTAGNTTLRVSNVGGAGAQTVNGIPVVTVDGASNGTFALQGDYVIGGQQAVIGGVYAYTLQKNGIATPNDGNWYLRSSLVNGATTNPPPVSQPPIYQPGAPLYEAYPEVLLALNGLPTLQQRAGNRYWRDAASAQASDPGTSSQSSALWARIEGQHQAMNPGTSTTGTRWTADQMKLQTGVDGLLMESDAGRLFAGFTAQYTRASNRIKSFFGNGNIGVNGYSVGGTATWAASNDFYVDAQAQATWYDSDLTSSTLGQRMTNGNKGFGRAFGVEAGRRLTVNDTWSMTPQAQLVYSSVSFDGFTDPFGARVNSDKSESLTSRLGVSLNHSDVWNNRAGHAVRGNFYAIANLYYEFMGNTSVDVGSVPLSARGDRLWGGLGVGGSVNWKDGRYALYGELLAKTSLANPGHSYGYQGTVGARMKW
ncbi:autotransporter outer membrane beta-barrel domain-containing protein [Burkholderia multivorans]|uniref:autotransporter outer membrane beta-barrel domain-containing protein n=1 Tax=Burkholderia multivorans TaxID=87883 RepID=UPI0021C1B379|nr:autotransporter outer membrane beta-barrel domain-containing protein [Burkholderia multivorans]